MPAGRDPAGPLPAWLGGAPGDWRIAVWAQPGASRSGVAGVQDDSLKIRIAARPVDGAANAALLAWLADRLGVPRRSLTIVRGDTGRRKLLALAAPLPAAELVARLQPNSGSPQTDA